MFNSPVSDCHWFNLPFVGAVNCKLQVKSLGVLDVVVITGLGVGVFVGLGVGVYVGLGVGVYVALALEYM